MDLTAIPPVINYRTGLTAQILRIMKFTAFLILAACLHVSATGHSQKVTLHEKNASLEKLFRSIHKQTGFQFVYNDETMKDAKPVSINVSNTPLEEVLTICFQNQPLEYTMQNNAIVIKQKRQQVLLSMTPDRPVTPSPPTFDIKGRILNERSEPVLATVTVRGTNHAVSTNSNGEFEIKGVDENTILIITGISIETKEVKIIDDKDLTIVIKTVVQTLDEMVIRGYYNTTKRLNTGSVGKVTSDIISRQPVSNPIATLQGRVPGLIVTQSNGLPGGAFSIRIRGQNSIFQGTTPLYLIDGVPFGQNRITSNLSQIGQSPFSSINPSDIESIEVLKDADATAIYGSQGANGVILITTKKGSPGKTKISISYQRGFGEITRTTRSLNLQEYLQMRREAFKNDGITPTVTNAPDLLVWDTTKSTNWEDLLIGGTAINQDIQASLSGGDVYTQFRFSANYNTQTTVYPGDDLPTNRGSVHLSLTHKSRNNKFKALFQNSYSSDIRRLPISDLTNAIFLPPNAPDFYDSSGKLSWTNWIGIDNPMAPLLTKYKSETNNLLTNAVLSYELFKGLNIKSMFGYSIREVNEENQIPIKSRRPSPTATGQASIQSTTFKKWIIEPQLSYGSKISKGKFEILTGLSFKKEEQYGNSIAGTNYTNDDFLGNIAAAGQVAVTSNYSQFKYSAAYGNLNFNWANKYIINGSFRRDGSSRFGPAERFANFFAVGGAWIFSEESIIKKHLSFMSFGKLRFSFGETGNDNISDYAFLDAWSVPSSTFPPYQGTVGLLPTSLFNSYLQWERTKKSDLALELGFFKDRIMLNINYYTNKSDNQIIGYVIPSQTGFSSITANRDASIRNSGLELELSTVNIKGKKFEWTTNFNFTKATNELLRYPGLERSNNRFSYKIGEPLTVFFGYNFLGINPENGIYRFQDLDSNGSLSSTDLLPVGNLAPEFYGGIDNSIKFNNWQLDIFFQYVNQPGRTYLGGMPTIPGNLGNQPEYVLGRWQKPGDISEIQKFTTATAGVISTAYRNLRSSSALIQNASFIRLKNLSLSYSMPSHFLSKAKLGSMRIYFSGQNLWTITKYNGADPETQSFTALPPLKVFAAGIQLTF